MFEMGTFHAAADGEFGPRPNPAHRGRRACPASATFRRARMPRAPAVQPLSIANARFKHRRDSAQQKDMVASGKGSVHGSSEWVWAYDPPSVWDKDAIVP